MLIGITYDLRDDYKDCGLSAEEISEFDSIETINALANTIRDLGYEVEKIGNAKALVQLLAKGKKWDLVFNIAEGLKGLAREAQIPALLDLYEIPYVFSSPDVMVNTLDKSVAKLIVKEAGIKTPQFVVVHKIADLKNINLEFPLFAKPLAEGTGKGISPSSYISNKKELEKSCKELLTKFKQPVLVETYLSGREFTVGLIGNEENLKVIGVLEVILKEGAEQWSHSYHNKENCEELVEYKLVDDEEAREAAKAAKLAWQALNCKDAGRIDLRSNNKSQPYFLEANPLSGLNPGHSDLPILAEKSGISYQKLIKQIIDSAKERYGL